MPGYRLRSNIAMTKSTTSPLRPGAGSLPRGRHRLQREVVLASQRGRLLTAFVELAADRGYDAVTIIDIVSRAGTSKRTFYDHFQDKQDCLVQAFDTAKSLLISAIVGEAGPVEDPVRRIEVGVRAYVDALSELPDFSRLFLSESMSAGKQLADLWIDSTEAFAEVLVGWRSESRVLHPEVPELTQLHALSVILALNELICITVHRGGVDAVAHTADDLVALAVKLLTAP
jgi:AcrR family transcriptional regulator